MRAAAARVAVVDDDESVRESLPDLLRELGFDAHAFASAEAFLASPDLRATQCAILDVAMPGMRGPELHQELKRLGLAIPVIFITAWADAATAATLQRQGAVECLMKPFSETALLRALSMAMPVA